MKYINQILFILISSISLGQSVNDPIFDSLSSTKFLLEVKQLDQFFKRFNNEENISTGEEKSFNEIARARKNPIAYQTERKKMLLFLTAYPLRTS
ncbi:MAG: hypothetical protein WCS03_18775 [Bacteroidota bacterium]